MNIDKLSARQRRKLVRLPKAKVVDGEKVEVVWDEGAKLREARILNRAKHITHGMNYSFKPHKELSLVA